jgi:hypothetical protein
VLGAPVERDPIGISRDLTRVAGRVEHPPAVAPTAASARASRTTPSLRMVPPERTANANATGRGSAWPTGTCGYLDRGDDRRAGSGAVDLSIVAPASEAIACHQPLGSLRGPSVGGRGAVAVKHLAGVHSSGDERTEWSPGVHERTLVILVAGQCVSFG